MVNDGSGDDAERRGSELRIEVIEAEVPLGPGGPEVWLRVLSRDLVDLPTVLGRLSTDQRTMMADCEAEPYRYFPGRPEEDELAEGFANDDYWVFRVRAHIVHQRQGA